MSRLDMIAPTQEHLDEALDALAACVRYGCYTETGRYESNGSAVYANAMRLLSKHGRFYISREFGTVVYGRFIERHGGDHAKP